MKRATDERVAGGDRARSVGWPSLDWPALGSLRLRAKIVADGVYAGAHRSVRKGAGIEFGGHRAYVPGDDLRWLDVRSLLRHDHWLVRQFETETQRSLRLLVDASASMSYQGKKAPASKFAWASVVGAALARVAVAGGDRVGLDVIGAGGSTGSGLSLPVASGRQAFNRIVDALELHEAKSDLLREPHAFEQAVASVGRTAKRGAIVVILSDLLDLPENAASLVGGLATQGRHVVAVQVLDPDETDLPFEESVRLRALEGQGVVETDATSRQRYRDALGALQRGWRTRLDAHAGASLVIASTAEDPTSVVRAVLGAVR